VYERDYGKAADWWNVGILIIEMLTAENPLRGDNRRESEQLTKNRDISSCIPSYVQPSAKEVVMAFLERDATKRLGCVMPAGVAGIKAHKFFAPINWDQLMAQEMPVPFEPDLEYEKPSRQPVPKEFANQLDYFCNMVDYMKTSMNMRSTWPLEANDQKVFDGFDYTSNKVFEDDLVAAHTSFSMAGAGLANLNIK